MSGAKYGADVLFRRAAQRSTIGRAMASFSAVTAGTGTETAFDGSGEIDIDGCVPRVLYLPYSQLPIPISLTFISNQSESQRKLVFPPFSDGPETEELQPPSELSGACMPLRRALGNWPNAFRQGLDSVCRTPDSPHATLAYEPVFDHDTTGGKQRRCRFPEKRRNDAAADILDQR